MDVWKPRVTVAAIAQRGDKYLMVEETIRGKLWLNQPAGHLESGESLIDACKREVLEESGWRCEPTSMVGVWQWRANNGRQFLRFTFAVELLEELENHPLDDGIEQTLWLSSQEIAAERHRLRSPIIEASLARMAEDRNVPLDIVECLL
ncbi:MAG: NUDIX hydrolase [Lysobacteraceae bacterium]|nr:MAG: NUDIX hydrolase [Xanthomonadaceae bacterium]